MPRPQKTDRPVSKCISLPTSLVARVDLELYSEVEGKVPHGAWQEFLVGLINQHFYRAAVKPQKLVEVATAAQAYADAAIADSWKGGGHPEDIPLLEADLREAQAKLEQLLGTL